MIRGWLFLGRLLKSQVGFLIGTTVSGYGFAYLYLIAMGRLLGPADFGILGAFFAVFYIAALLGQALRESIATRVAAENARAGKEAAAGAFFNIAPTLGILCLLPSLAVIVALKPIGSFFHTDSKITVILLAFSLFTALALDLILGLMQGLQRFKELGTTGYVTSQGLKLVLGLFFVWIGWGLLGAVSALFASTAIATLIGFALVKKELFEGFRFRVISKPKLVPILAPALILAVFLSMPASVDVMLVTHFFGGTEAGLYTAVSTIGKIVVFLPMGVTMILLPRATEDYALGLNTRHILLQSLTLTLLLSGAVTLIFWIFSDAVIAVAFGEAYMKAAQLIGLYAVAMLFFSINVVLVHFSLAIRNLWLMAIADIITVAEVVFIIFLHNSLSQVIWILFWGNLLILALTLPHFLLRKSRQGSKGRDIW